LICNNMSDSRTSPDEENESPQSADSLYLQQLEYKPKVGRTWLNFFIRNFRVTVLIVISMLAWGIFSFFALPLESMPEVKIPYGIVSVALPGASPEDMEELVVDKIESKLTSLKGVKQIRSTSMNSFASITVEFRAEEDLKDAIRRLRDAVSGIKNELPSEATDPSVMEVSFSSSPVWTLVVTGPYDNFTLRKYAEIVQKEIEKLPETDSVSINGGDTFEIKVIFDPKKLQQYGLSVDMVNGMIKANNLALPLGSITVSNFDYSIRSEGKFTGAADLRRMPVFNINNQIIRLQDVATVVEMAKERTVFSKFSVEGGTTENAVTLNVVKKTGGSIISLIDTGKKRVETLGKTFPADLKIETTLDYSTIIKRDFEQLWTDGLLTILLVTLVLFLFVGLKEAFVAGLAVPLVFACTFGIMNLAGITLNFLSLFSLILSLGLLVDDAIVVVQATKQYLKTGKFTPEEAVLLVFRDYKILLATTTLTTIWAFVPLLMATGIIGSFIKSIPITVSVTLAVSFFVAIIINHPMAIILERFRITRAYIKPFFAFTGLGTLAATVMTLTGAIPAVPGIITAALLALAFFSLLFWYRKSLKASLLENEDMLLQEQADPDKIKAKIYHHYLAPDEEKSFWARAIGGVVKMERILPRYGKILASFLNSKARSLIALIIVGIIFMGALFLPASGILRSEFMGAADSEYLYVNIEGPPGLVSEKTGEVAAQVEKFILEEKAIKTFSAVTGSGGVNLKGGMMTSIGGSQGNKAQFAINLYPLAERPANPETGKVEKSYEIGQRLRQRVAPVSGATVTVVEMSGGPPTGADFEARISGDDMKELEKQANRYKKILSEIPGTINEDISIELSPGEFSLRLDPDQMQLRGITSAQLASTLRTAISGSEVTKVMQGGDELIVRAEFDEDSVKTIDGIKSLTLMNSRGQAYQLGDIATITLGSSLTSISRVDQKRVVSVTASVVKPHLPGEVLVKFQELLKTNPLPEGYEIAFGGYNETNTESIYSILRAMLVAMILIIGTLVVQFNSFKKAVLVLATIPLALTGVFYGLALVGFTLSFPSLIGILALFGIVVKNAVILVDKINLNLKVGIPFREAIIDASGSRMEAIFLTSICTIIGMFPLTFANETWQGLGASLIFGLSTSTFLTLFVIPILFNLLMESGHRKQVKLEKYRDAADAVQHGERR
jgi:multidrug efflux pump subunit AcrB